MSHLKGSSSCRHGKSNRSGGCPWTIAGIVVLVLMAATFCWVFPELRRYMHIEKM